jgi:hypothetical protein
VPECYLGFATYSLKIITDQTKTGKLGLLIHTAHTADYYLVTFNFSSLRNMPINSLEYKNNRDIGMNKKYIVRLTE